MTRLSSALDALGAIAATHELLALGFTPGQLHFAAKSGDIYRPRKGWYASPALSPHAVRAWRVGGRLACLSAAVEHGLWVPEFSGMHIEVKHSDSRLRTPTDRRTRLASPQSAVNVHWTSTPSAGSRSAVSASSCIRQIFECAGAAAGYIVLESALNQSKLDLIAQHELIDALPHRFRSLARKASHLSDSGSESEMKLLLMSLHIPFRQQVLVAGKWPVDFLIGEHLAIEVDSKAHHSNPYRDRKKDAELSAASVRVLRFMYSQVRFEKPAVERAIVSAIARGDAHSA